MTPKMLVSYSAQSTHVQTTLDYLNAISTYSGFDVAYVHVTHNAVMDFNINEYDILFHNYCGRLYLPGYVSSSFRKAVSTFRGLKVVAIQDEYDHTNEVKRAIKELGFHVVLTCVPQEFLEYVYPQAEFPGVTFKTVLTGYVPDHLQNKTHKILPIEERPIFLGYRGRDLGGLYGKLGHEKYEIGRRMKEICDARGIQHDIAVDEQSRIYGDKWFKFIGSCRAMLGSESGSNVFDFDGSIREKYDELASQKGGRVSYEEFQPYVEQRDSEIDMGQISPRVFECAILKTPMVLFRGRYSNALTPDIHYIPLEKDFSNIDDVLAQLNDINLLETLADRAYDHLVASKKYSYQAFWKMLANCLGDERVSRRLDKSHSESQQRSASSLDRTLHPTDFEQRPTPVPQGMEIFVPKIQIMVGSITDSKPVPYKIARRMWRLMPLKTRLRVLGQLLRVLDENTVPESLSLPMKIAIKTWRRVPYEQRSKLLRRINIYTPSSSCL